MDNQTAFWQLLGQVRITDLLIFILAAGYIVPQLKKLYAWLRSWLRETENREQAIGNAEKLGDYHQQSIQIRNGLQKQIDAIKGDLDTIKDYHRENEAVKLGIQAILRESIVSNYNKYKDRGYIPIYARESVKKIYEAYTDLGGNDVAHDLYDKMRRWDTDPEEREEVKEHE